MLNTNLVATVTMLYNDAVALQVMPHAEFLELLNLSKESVLAEPLTMQQVRYSSHMSIIFICTQFGLVVTSLGTSMKLLFFESG